MLTFLYFSEQRKDQQPPPPASRFVHFLRLAFNVVEKRPEERNSFLAADSPCPGTKTVSLSQEANVFKVCLQPDTVACVSKQTGYNPEKSRSPVYTTFCSGTRTMMSVRNAPDSSRSRLSIRPNPFSSATSPDQSDDLAAPARAIHNVEDVRYHAEIFLAMFPSQFCFGIFGRLFEGASATALSAPCIAP